MNRSRRALAALLTAAALLLPRTTHADLIPDGMKSADWTGLVEGQDKFTAKYDFFFAIIGYGDRVTIDPAPGGYKIPYFYRLSTAVVVALPKGQLTAPALARLVRKSSDLDSLRGRNASSRVQEDPRQDEARLRAVPGVVLSRRIQIDRLVNESTRITSIVERYTIAGVTSMVVLDVKRETHTAGKDPAPLLAGAASIGGLFVLALARRERRRARSLVAAPDDRR